jgi:Fe-S-cluster containining protein
MDRDEDGDYVFKSSPCPFLASDNACSIYEFRPKACREYPHTNRPQMKQILDLTFKNATVCPAVKEILKRIDSTEV